MRKDPLTLLKDYKEHMKRYITSRLIKSPIKCYIVIYITFVKKDKDGGEPMKLETYFRSFTETILRSTEINAFLEQANEKIETSFDQFLKRGSGWILETIDYLKISGAEFAPMRVCAAGSPPRAATSGRLRADRPSAFTDQYFKQ